MSCTNAGGSTPALAIATLATAAVLAGAGCGNSKGEASVESCESWREGMVCGELDYREEFSCEIYAEERCDVSLYFYCLEQNTSCDEETSTFDLSGWDKCQAAAGCAD